MEFAVSPEPLARRDIRAVLRNMPREVQQIAFEDGSYIPADRKDRP